MLKKVRRNTLGDILARTRARLPNKFAIAYKENRLTYAELDDLVNQTAHAFLDHGINKGDMIAIMSKNSLDFVISEFALARIGAVMVPINFMLNVEDVTYILNHAKVSGLISSIEMC